MLDFYHLSERPFSLLPNPRFMYLSEQYLETKAKVLYFLQDRSASLYPYGPIGRGKTPGLRYPFAMSASPPEDHLHLPTQASSKHWATI